LIDYNSPQKASTTHFHQDDNDVCFNLNTETFHQTHPGFGCIKNFGFEDHRKQIVFDYLEIIKFVTDPRDIVDELLSAELLEDGSGMIVSGEPLLPQYFLRNIDEIFSEKGQDGALLGSRKRDYARKMKVFHGLPKKTRNTMILFPKHMIGTNQFIGYKKKSDRKLVELRMFSNIFEYHTIMQGTGHAFPGYYVYWKIGIDGTMDDLSLDQNVGDEVTDAISGFNKLKLKEKTFGK
jgi:hypothetical protein